MQSFRAGVLDGKYRNIVGLSEFARGASDLQGRMAAHGLRAFEPEQPAFRILSFHHTIRQKSQSVTVHQPQSGF